MEQHCNNRYFGDKKNPLRFPPHQPILSLSLCLSLFFCLFHLSVCLSVSHYYYTHPPHTDRYSVCVYVYMYIYNTYLAYVLCICIYIIYIHIW